MISVAAPVITETCPGCQRPRSVLDMVQHVGFRQCLRCRRAHEEALEVLATGNPPRECSECYTPFEELRARGEIRMACHMENGLYRLMCLACDAMYVRKRRELYGPTQFGWEHKL